MGERGLEAVVERAGRVDEEASAIAHPVLDPATPAVTLEHEGEYWTLRLAGALCRLRDSRGLHMLARLVAAPGRDIHALDLVGGVAADGDAGEHLDGQALRGYRDRLIELRARQAHADDAADLGGQLVAREEITALERELARALGLGGRARRACAASERARVNARRRLADTIRRARSAVPALGAHLGECVVTGTFCSYDPRRARAHG